MDVLYVIVEPLMPLLVTYKFTLDILHTYTEFVNLASD
jgi:hypothetical protein